jgi:hypothetical protein
MIRDMSTKLLQNHILERIVTHRLTRDLVQHDGALEGSRQRCASPSWFLWCHKTVIPNLRLASFI